MKRKKKMFISFSQPVERKKKIIIRSIEFLIYLFFRSP